MGFGVNVGLGVVEGVGLGVGMGDGAIVGIDVGLGRADSVTIGLGTRLETDVAVVVAGVSAMLPRTTRPIKP